MGSRRRTIPLSEAEVDLLKLIYLENRYPSDQYERRPAERRRFVAQWNELAERSDTPEEVIHYIVTKRKAKKWVTFDGDYEKMGSMRSSLLTDDEWKSLKVAYAEIFVDRGLGSDNLRYDRALGSELAKRFRALTAHAVNPSLLLALIEAKRKRGEWIKVGNRGLGFSDINEVA